MPAFPPSTVMKVTGSPTPPQGLRGEGRIPKRWPWPRRRRRRREV